MKSYLISLLLAAGPAWAAGPVTMAPAPGTPADAAARTALAQDLAEAGRKGDKPLVLVGQAVLGKPQDRPALFVQLQSARECGSAGCSTSVLLWSGAAYRTVLDGAAGNVVVQAGRHRGMADLVADTQRYVWNGQEYVNSRPVPNINLGRR